MGAENTSISCSSTSKSQSAADIITASPDDCGMRSSPVCSATPSESPQLKTHSKSSIAGSSVTMSTRTLCRPKNPRISPSKCGCDMEIMFVLNTNQCSYHCKKK